VPAAELGLGRPRALALLGGALAGIGGFYLNAMLETWLLERIMPMPASERAALRRMIVPETGLRPLLFDLLVLSLAPAVSEEILFRGAVMRAFSARGLEKLAIGVSAVLFGAFHGSLYRFIPATAMGLLLGVTRREARSLWPAVVLHAVHNAAVVVATRLGQEDPLPIRTAAGVFLTVTAALALTGGIAIVRRAWQPR
jgi:membrane protease YdiL (CAAX protease family)